MENDEIIARIRWWQNNPYTYPLVCLEDKDHGALIPKETEDGQKVILACGICGYTRDKIPEFVLHNFFEVGWTKRR